MQVANQPDQGTDILRQSLTCRQSTPLTLEPVSTSDTIDILSRFEIVIVPGLDDSGPHHWQSRWEHFLGQQGVTIHRVIQTNWEQPSYPAWRRGLWHALAVCRRPTILVAHSLGAVLAARWASECPMEPVSGAFLVAPADVEQYSGPDAGRVSDFGPLPADRLPFPSILVASRNDEWLTMQRARAMARQWGSTMLDVGQLGHIGNRSDVGLWPAGLSALADLARSLSGISA
ncbi:alpha/beta hydrolase [Gluconacetobacter aggeris]|uniref:Alpha/beta hydrolase n=1 Tax=Gluconacetobacter aggeris TaxID=1286186 RepID=A0A7W4NVX8_9PROT|nr:alpha/beta hydrolase [Gluconacetobacter aggeris]MBB2168102.1 alpha/beta hydrolase [Gluconacetobacter aggeris]